MPAFGGLMALAMAGLLLSELFDSDDNSGTDPEFDTPSEIDGTQQPDMLVGTDGADDT